MDLFGKVVGKLFKDFNQISKELRLKNRKMHKTHVGATLSIILIVLLISSIFYFGLELIYK